MPWGTVTPVPSSNIPFPALVSPLGLSPCWDRAQRHHPMADPTMAGPPGDLPVPIPAGTSPVSLLRHWCDELWVLWGWSGQAFAGAGGARVHFN